MRLTVSSRNLDLDEASREEIKSLLRIALSRFGPRLGDVSARVEDLKGDPGARDKRCRIVVKVKRASQFSVEVVEDELFVAVSRAADRAARRVNRETVRGGT